MFEANHVPMHLWLQAMFLLSSSKKGISSNQLHRTLGVTLKPLGSCRIALGINDLDRTNAAIRGIVGKRLTYQTTNSGA